MSTDVHRSVPLLVHVPPFENTGFVMVLILYFIRKNIWLFKSFYQEFGFAYKECLFGESYLSTEFGPRTFLNCPFTQAD